MAVTWDYDGVAGDGTLSATIDDAVIGDNYMLLCDDDSSSSPPYFNVATNPFTVQAFGIDSTPDRSFVALLQHSPHLASLGSASDTLYANIFAEAVADTNGLPFTADWDYDGVHTTTVTITAVGGVTYYLWGRPTAGYEFDGPLGPFTDGSTQVLTFVHSDPTAGKRFAIGLGDWDTGDEYSVRIFGEGVSGAGDPGNPQSVAGAPTISDINPDSGCFGDSVVITGTNFTGATSVTFNGADAAFTVDSDTQITADVPADATSGSVLVTTPSGSDAISFTVNPAPGNNIYPYNLGGDPDFDGFAYAVDGNDGFDRGVKSGGCFSSSTRCATPEVDEPDPAPGFPANHSVWLTWRANFTGEVTAWLTSTDPDMADGILAAYDWTYLAPVGSLPAPLAQGDDELGTQPQISFAVVEDNRYVFQVDTRDLGGDFLFNWKRSDGTPPANDDFANAEVITGIGGETDGTTTTATAECGEPGVGGDPLDGPYNSVWYKWPAPEACLAIVKVAGKGVNGGNHDHNINVFRGSTLETLIPVATASGILGVYWPMTAGETYYIRIDNGETDPPSIYDSPGDPDDFTLLWETDSLDWRVRAGTFAAGDTHVETGLGDQVVAVIVYYGGVPDGEYSDDGYMIGAGAATADDQWATGAAYPRNSIHNIPTFTNTTPPPGTEYHQTAFSSASVIKVPGLLGGVYAEAAVVALNADGSFDLEWATDPADGSMCGYVAFSGIEAAAGTFAYDAGATGTEVVVPGIRTRAFMVGTVGRNDTPGSSPAPAGNLEVECWSEGVPSLGGAGDTPYGAGIESGVAWFGPSSYDGLFLNAPGATGQLVYQTDGQIGSLPAGKGAVLGSLSFDVHHDNPYFSGDFGWLALGGYGWHTTRSVSDDLPADFWVQAALAYGGGYMNVGGFDENDAQFDVTEWTNDYQTNITDPPDLSFATPTARTAHSGRIQTTLDPASGDAFEENYVESGHISVAVVPRQLDNVTVTKTGGDDCELVLFGNYLVRMGIISFAPVHLPHKSGVTSFR